MIQTKHQASFQINQRAEDLFPLFTPESEKIWVPGFDYENIMGSTELHEDYIFLTAGDPKDIWLVKRFEPFNYIVQYYMVTPYDYVSIISVRCTPTSNNSSEVEISYEHIGLSQEGEEYIKGRTAEGFENYIGKWKVWLEDYFAAVNE